MIAELTSVEEKVMENYLSIENETGITLNEEQMEAVLGASMAIENRSSQYTIHGLAGTGKTVVLSFLGKMYPDSFATAPTGKASLVLTGKMGREAGTIHSLFYQLVDEVMENGKRQPIFMYAPKIAHGSTVLLDECSMVDTEQRDDILRTGATLIAVGDPGQLRPVNRDPGFTTADFTLKQIQRQAAGSQIITQAHRVRHNQRYMDIGDPAFKVVHGLHNLSNTDLLGADMVLCWRNKTALDLNMKIRKQKFGFINHHANKGEQVLCLRNWNEHGIQNGGIYEVSTAYNPAKKSIGIINNGSILNLKFSDWRQQPQKPMKTSFDFGYCCTIHKAQGSEWSKVILIDEYYGDEKAEWLYTGITRAAKEIIVVKI